MGHFKIAAAQIASLRGDVSANLVTHAGAVTAAARHGVSTLVFPELSLTGYEPDLAATLAFTNEDERLAPLRRLAAENQTTLVVGAPVRNGTGKPAIGAFILTPACEIKTYLKMHLGQNEAPFFSHGDTPFFLGIEGQQIGIAICADSSRRSHPSTYAELGADTYAAGVFLTEEWYETDASRFRTYAADFGMLTLMANHGASSGTYTSVGKSAAWAPGGDLLVQATGVDSVLVTATLGTSGWQGEIVKI
jgi:predicted amidohydrolase